MDVDSGIIAPYQDLVREDIKLILQGRELDEQTIVNTLKRRPSEFIEEVKKLIDRDACGEQHTIHGLLVKTILNLKFLPFQEYLPMVEYQVLPNIDKPGKAVPLLQHTEPIEDIVRELDTLECAKKDVIEASKIVLRAFKRSGIEKLSKFQRDYIRQYVSDKCTDRYRVYVLEAPTGSGKTLIFMFMALMEALIGSRSLIIYPRKQLAEDQANILIKYIYILHDELKSYSHYKFKDPTLLIIDGDHPNAPQKADRGKPLTEVVKKSLKCPIHNTELLLGDDYTIKCKNGHSLSFLYVFKEDLQHIPSIIITNRFVLLTRLLHKKVKIENFLENISLVVFDEAHSYINFEGGDTAYLIRFLRDYISLVNSNIEPRIVLSSATMPSPVEFAKDLTGVDFRTILHFDYDSYKTDAYRLVIPLLLLPTPQFSAETVAQMVALVTLLWDIKYDKKSLVFIDGRAEITRLFHFIKEIILEHGGFDAYRQAGDIILYHTTHGIHQLKAALPRYQRYKEDCHAMWDHLIEPGSLQNLQSNNINWKQYLQKLKNNIDFHYALHSGRQRTSIFNRFRSGDAKMLLATSTLELGIDIPDVSVVVQYKLPMKSEGFIQRIGRAGRNLESYRVVIGAIILSQSPHSAAYMYDRDLQEKLIDVKKLPKPPVNITNKNLQLKYQFYRLLIDYKRNGGNTHYPVW